MDPDDELLRDSCTRFLALHGSRDPARHLAALPEDLRADTYGDGGVVADLEAEVAHVLGSPAAAFMPTGTMAQQIALRIHADDRACRTVVLHPTAHPAMHEDGAAERLHGLHLRQVGWPTAPQSVDDLTDVAEPVAALLLELPQRELGGALPTWEALQAMVAWARDRDVSVHLDGARLWECGPAYQRPYAEIAGLFDSTYVSFYKGLGGVAGACLAGSEDLVARAREWRHRHGGTLYGMWPVAATALSALRLRLDRMPAYLHHARAIAEALRDLDGVRVRVDPPPTPFMHLDLRVGAEDLHTRTRALAAAEGIWTFSSGVPSGHPGWQRVELHVGDATTDFAPPEIRRVLSGLVAPPEG